MDATGLTAAEAAQKAAAMNRLAAAYYITAQGVPFIHAGEEMLRSKPDAQQDNGFNHNSYASGDAINSIKWSTLADELVDNAHDYYQGLIAFRKAHAALRMTKEAEVLATMSELTTGSNDVIAILNKGGNGEDVEILSIFNAGADEAVVTLPEGEWEAYVMGDKAGTTVLATFEGEATVGATSTMILVKAAAEEDPTEELDLTELIALFELLKTLNPEDYTEESVEAVQEVIQAIIEAFSDEELVLTQEDVDAMADALKQAIDALVPIEPEETDPEETDPTETEPSEPETTEPEETQKPTEKPGTGDNSQTGDAFQMAWFAVLAVSALATAALVASRKKLF
jgi:hypothetical protein